MGPWYIILLFFNLPISRADLKQSNQIVTIRYIKQRGVIIIKNVIQNQRTKYIFWFMIFCDNTHNPLVSCSPPPAPTLGRVQLKKKNHTFEQFFIFWISKMFQISVNYLVSSGKTWQNGFGLNFCSSGWRRLKFMTSMPKYQNLPCKNMSINQKLPINMTKFKNSVKANFQKYQVLRWNIDL